MKRLVLSLAAMTAVLGFTAAAEAATATGTLNVTANSVASCSVTTTAVNFGDITGLGATNANGDVSVNCSSGIPYNISLDAGTHMGMEYTYWRAISNGSINRAYVLYTTSVGGEWGDADFANTYSGATSQADNGNGLDQAHTVYGVLGGGGTLPVGTFSDTVTVTVNY